jgi:hypothetical protein
VANDNTQKGKDAVDAVVTQEGGTLLPRPSTSEKPAEIAPCLQLQALSSKWKNENAKEGRFYRLKVLPMVGVNL